MNKTTKTTRQPTRAKAQTKAAPTKTAKAKKSPQKARAASATTKSQILKKLAIGLAVSKPQVNVKVPAPSFLQWLLSPVTNTFRKLAERTSK